MLALDIEASVTLMSPKLDPSGFLHDFFMSSVNPMLLLNSAKTMVCTLWKFRFNDSHNLQSWNDFQALIHELFPD